MSEINDAAVEAAVEGLDYTDIANRAQEATGRSIWPRTAEAVITAALPLLTAALPHLTPEPRVITTAEEMEALPIGSIVLDLHGDAGLIDGIGPEGSVLFAETAPMALSYATKHYAPFTVLYTPEGDRP